MVPGHRVLPHRVYFLSMFTDAGSPRAALAFLSRSSGKRPKIALPANGRIDELFPAGTPAWVPVGGKLLIRRRVLVLAEVLYRSRFVLKRFEGRVRIICAPGP